MTTASTPSTKLATQPQARKIADQIGSMIEKAILGGQLPADDSQALIEQEKDLKVGSRVVELLKTIIAEIIKWVTIRCNYDAPNAIAQAIEDNQFGYKYLDLPADQIPLLGPPSRAGEAGSGEVDHEIGEVHLNQEGITTREVLRKINTSERNFCDPLTALRYAAERPDRQRQYPLAILFEDANGQLWDLILYEGDGGRRVVVRRGNLDDGWIAGCRFLVVRKPARNA